MSKPVIIVLIILGTLMALALAVSSMGPRVIPTGTLNTRDTSTPTITNRATQSALPDLGFRMPLFQGITAWWNTPDNEELTEQDLRGKVVLVKFWTYSCINCIRTYPFIKRWHELYRDNGFILIGVHTPEFTEEGIPANVEREIRKNGFTFPVALDPDYTTWNAYNNHYWPATYLFDTEGRLRYTHFGEGRYEETEQAIRDLLEEAGTRVTSTTPMPTEMNLSGINTRETYFGYNRAEHFVNQRERVNDRAASYTLATVKNDEWSIGGTWTIEDQRAIANMNATHRFNVQAPEYNIVLGTPNNTTSTIEVTMDGKPLPLEYRTPDITVDDQGRTLIRVNELRLYRITHLPNAERATIDLRIVDGVVHFYAASFG
jgi:thiol-disulfide isomerase/thioredoxin